MPLKNKKSTKNTKNSEKSTQTHIAIEETRINEIIDAFKCPVCSKRVRLKACNSIICPKDHCFDISRSGYINLLLKPSKHKYDKEMFESRSIICKKGFFDPMIESVAGLIDKFISGNSSNNDDSSGNRSCARILDAGCGEGYHLYKVMKVLQDKRDIHTQGIGIDISKDGIQIAAKNYKDITWCVADLAQIPFLDKKFDVVLNILSPSNYSEFSRILRIGGVLIKVVPNSGYLRELRGTLYEGTDKEQYSNEKVIEYFGRNFEIMDTQNIRYNVPVSNEELVHLIKMTPLSWSVPEERIRKALDSKIDNVTADFTVIIGKSKPSNQGQHKNKLNQGQYKNKQLK